MVLAVRGVMHDFDRAAVTVICMKRQSAGQQDVQRHTQRIDIRLVVNG